MALPSFISPPFLLSNYSHFGADLQLYVSNGIYATGGIPNHASRHSAVSKFFSVYNASIVNNLTRAGGWLDSQTGSITCYFELMYEPGTNYSNPLDFIRLKVQSTKQNTGPISVSNPIKVDVSVITGQLGIVYTYPSYYLSSQSIPEAGVLINVGIAEGSGYADVNVQWNDVVNGKWFSYNINNYPFSMGTSSLWRYHSRLNIEGLASHTVIEDYQMLSALSAITPTGIPSAEAFGSVVVALTPTQNITVDDGIPSQQLFGIPTISSGLTYIIAIGIPSQEAFGLHRLIRTTTIESSIGKPALPKEGDIRITLDPYKGYGEMVLDDRDVERDPGLETCVLITLGTNRKINTDDVKPDNSLDSGGWWGDAVPVIEGDLVGTRLWLLRRAKTNNELINASKEYLKEGFQWMLNDNVISNLYVETWIAEKDTLGIILGFLRPNLQTIYYKYFYNWENQELRSA